MTALVESLNSSDNSASKRGKKSENHSSSTASDQKKYNKISVVPATGPGPEKKKGDIQKSGKKAEEHWKANFCEHRQRKAKSY